MIGDQRKIQQLEEELEKLSAQVDFFKKEINQLKENSHILETTAEKKEDNVAPVKKNSWEIPSFKRESSAGLESFIGLKLLHLTGIVVLVAGISIGVKYAVDKELISVGMRIILAYAAGVILYILSARLKGKYELFSAILFSGAMASFYFTTYAAFAYYQLFSFGWAFFIMAAITILTAFTAIVYNRQEIAILGMTGAYGIPFLISANSDRADLLFAYIILINTGIVFLSYKKEWKGMVRLAMLVSWILFIGWAVTRYEQSMQQSAILIMAAFYLLFTLAAFGFSIKRKQPIGIIELQLFLINSVLTYVAALLIFTNSKIDAISAAAVTGVACFIFTIQTVLVRFLLPAEKLLLNYLSSFAVLSLVFYAGMQWDGVTVTIIWLVIAIVLFVAGITSKMAWLRLMSILLTGFTLLKLVVIDRANFSTVEKIISYISIGVLLLLFSFFYQRYKQTSAESGNTA
ncbi:hypothetical protein CAP36_05250 [Chitinophagaceae bacterium IBVUCB2]|nr:hypothetical protein CAP36_05250 [Chitinophagaceae bacterium IBVUCB2]